MKAIKRNKSEFSVEQFIGGQFAIVDNTNQKVVFGGDSANEDHYNEEYINDVFERWDGTLKYTGEIYGYQIEA
jgi:hypothetical protein